MAGQITDFRRKLRALNAEVERVYGDDGRDAMLWWEQSEKLKEQRAILLDSYSFVFKENFIKIDKSVAKALRKTGRRRRFFKKKNFYFMLTPEEKAVIFAVRAKDEREKIEIPKKLGKYSVGGIFDFQLTDRYSKRLLSQSIEIKTKKRTDRKKVAALGIYSFRNIAGLDGLEELALRDEGGEVTVSSSVKVLDSAVLPNAKVLRLPSTLTYLGVMIAPKLERVEIYDCGEPSTDCSVSHHAFSTCEKLSDVTLPTGVKNALPQLFSSNYELARLSIPERTEKLPTVYRREKFKEICIQSRSLDGETQEICCARAVINSEVIHCIRGEIEDLTLSGNAKMLKPLGIKVRRLTLPASMEELCDGALSELRDLENLVLPSGVHKIGARAFEKSGLTEMCLPDGVKTLDYRVFADCDRLEKLRLPRALTTLSTDCFEGCTALRELVLPDSLTAIKPHFAASSNEIFLGYKDGKSLSTKLIDLRMLGAKNAIDPFLRMHLVYNENTPAAAAVAAYKAVMRKNIEANIASIEEYLSPLDNLKVTRENIDHVTAAICYTAAVMPAGAPLLLTLTGALAEFFKEVVKKTDDEADFVYCNYFFDTIKRLGAFGQKEAFDLLESCRAALAERITASTKHALKGEKLLSKNTAKAREEALYELVRAYHIYPRNAPTVIALIHWFASDPLLYDTKAVEMLMDILEVCAKDTDIGIDYMVKAKELIAKVKNPGGEFFGRFLTLEEKSQLYVAEFGSAVRYSSGESRRAPSTEARWREDLKTPKRLSLLIDEAFFKALRTEVRSRMVSSFGGTVEFGERKRTEKLDAIDAAEATIFPKKKKALEERLRKRREEEAKKLRAEQERLHRAQMLSTSSASSGTYDDDRYGYGKGYDDSISLFPSTFYSYSYNNPYSPVTELSDWARAEAIGIEWDIIDRDYYLDLGIFGDHSL